MSNANIIKGTKIHEAIELILSTMVKKVEQEVPSTYDSYNSYGTNLTISDPVMTNKGVACYCSKHDNFDATLWVGIDWCHKEAGRPLKGVTVWMPLISIGE